MKTSIACEILYLFNDITGGKLGMSHPDKEKYPGVYYCKGDSYSERRAKILMQQENIIEKQTEIIREHGEVMEKQKELIDRQKKLIDDNVKILFWQKIDLTNNEKESAK